MQKRTVIFKLTAVILAIAGMAATTQPAFVKPSDIDLGSLLAAPPAPDSDIQKSEIEKILEWQNKRTATDVARCKSEEQVSPFIFSEVLGDKFVATALPVTANLLEQVQGDIKNITKLAKVKWSRKRPPIIDSRVHPCVALEQNGSYPSAHAVRGIVWARILAEIYPEKKAELLARGRLMGEDRVIAGIHFPSDVAAGQKLGDAIADKLMDNTAFQQALQAARDECLKADLSKATK